MSDLFADLDALFSEEELQEEIVRIRNYGFVREPENAGAPVDKLHEALLSLANDYTRDHG